MTVSLLQGRSHQSPSVLASADALEAPLRPSSSGGPRLESIDGLRGIACLMVLLFHSVLRFGSQAWPALSLGRWTLAPIRLLSFGYGGVDLFFVLSGFCLAYPIVSRPERAVCWKRYAINRVRRILPPYWAALALFGAFSLLIQRHHTEPFMSQHVLDWPGARQVMAAALLYSSTLNPSFWTLPIEWRWYFLFPLMMLVWSRARARGLFVWAVPVSLFSIFVVPHLPLHGLRGLMTLVPTYLPLFALGIWAAHLASPQARSQAEKRLVRLAPWGALGAALLIALYAPVTQKLFGHPLGLMGSNVGVARLALWGPLCFFVTLAATQAGAWQRVVSWRPLVWVGLFSYSLYLTHEPFLAMAAALVLPLHWPPAALLGFSVVLLPAVLVGFAFLFFLAAERPFLRYRPTAAQPCSAKPD